MDEKSEQYNRRWNDVYYRLGFIEYLRENTARILQEASVLSSYGERVVAGNIEAIALNIRLITETITKSAYHHIFGEAKEFPGIKNAVKQLKEHGISWKAKSITERTKKGEKKWFVPNARNEGINIEGILAVQGKVSKILHVSRKRSAHDYHEELDYYNNIEPKLRVFLNGSILYEGDKAILMWYWEDGRGHTSPLTKLPGGA